MFHKSSEWSNFNPRSPCGERRLHFAAQILDLNFNPRSPCGERPGHLPLGPEHHLFQSTLSLRRATVRFRSAPLAGRYFNPRSPCGERRHRLPDRFLQAVISIHALLAESDQAADELWADLHNFNPRSPCGERLHDHRRRSGIRYISIHALLAESDNR